MNIATRIFCIFLIILSLLSAVIVAMSHLADSRKQSTDMTLRLYQYRTLVGHLQQKSNDLTRLARIYVMT